MEPLTLTPRDTDLTPVFLEALALVDPDPDPGRYSLVWAIRLAAETAGSGFVDSDALVRVLPVYGPDYVRYVLRETPHICRHTIGGGRYRVHAEPQCSSLCDEKYVHRAPSNIASRPCHSCFISAPLTVSECPYCGQTWEQAA